MNELSRFQFQTEQNGTNMVSGRMRHRALEIKTPYRKWFPRVCEQNEYEEGEDYITSDKKVRRADGIPMPYDLHDHWLTLNMAKEICLLQHPASANGCGNSCGTSYGNSPPAECSGRAARFP